MAPRKPGGGVGAGKSPGSGTSPSVARYASLKFAVVPTSKDASKSGRKQATLTDMFTTPKQPAAQSLGKQQAAATSANRGTSWPANLTTKMGSASPSCHQPVSVDSSASANALRLLRDPLPATPASAAPTPTMGHHAQPLANSSEDGVAPPHGARRGLGELGLTAPAQCTSNQLQVPPRGLAYPSFSGERGNGADVAAAAAAAAAFNSAAPYPHGNQASPQDPARKRRSRLQLPKKQAVGAAPPSAKCTGASSSSSNSSSSSSSLHSPDEAQRKAAAEGSSSSRSNANDSKNIHDGFGSMAAEDDHVVISSQSPIASPANSRDDVVEANDPAQNPSQDSAGWVSCPGQGHRKGASKDWGWSERRACGDEIASERESSVESQSKVACSVSIEGCDFLGSSTGLSSSSRPDEPRLESSPARGSRVQGGGLGVQGMGGAFERGKERVRPSQVEEIDEVFTQEVVSHRRDDAAQVSRGGKVLAQKHNPPPGSRRVSASGGVGGVGGVSVGHKVGGIVIDLADCDDGDEDDEPIVRRGGQEHRGAQQQQAQRGIRSSHAVGARSGIGVGGGRGEDGGPKKRPCHGFGVSAGGRTSGKGRVPKFDLGDDDDDDDEEEDEIVSQTQAAGNEPGGAVRDGGGGESRGVGVQEGLPSSSMVGRGMNVGGPALRGGGEIVVSRKQVIIETRIDEHGNEYEVRVETGASHAQLVPDHGRNSHQIHHMPPPQSARGGYISGSAAGGAPRWGSAGGGHIGGNLKGGQATSSSSSAGLPRQGNTFGGYAPGPHQGAPSLNSGLPRPPLRAQFQPFEPSRQDGVGDVAGGGGGPRGAVSSAAGGGEGWSMNATVDENEMVKFSSEEDDEEDGAGDESDGEDSLVEMAKQQMAERRRQMAAEEGSGGGSSRGGSSSYNHARGGASAGSSYYGNDGKIANPPKAKERGGGGYNRGGGKAVGGRWRTNVLPDGSHQKVFVQKGGKVLKGRQAYAAGSGVKSVRKGGGGKRGTGGRGSQKR